VKAVAARCEAHRLSILLAGVRRSAENIRDTADKNFQLLKANPDHPSPHLKKVGRYWSIRAGIHYRALAVEDGDDPVWFRIGQHGEYDRRIKDH
jgi:hypothetical protein